MDKHLLELMIEMRNQRLPDVLDMEAFKALAKTLNDIYVAANKERYNDPVLAKVADSAGNYSDQNLRSVFPTEETLPNVKKHIIDIRQSLSKVAYVEFEKQLDKLMNFRAPPTFVNYLMACKGVTDLLYTDDPKKRFKILKKLGDDDQFLKAIASDREAAAIFLKACVNNEPKLMARLLLTPFSKTLGAPELENGRYKKFHCPATRGVIRGNVVKVQRGDVVEYFDAAGLQKALNRSPNHPITNEPMKFSDPQPATEEYRTKLINLYQRDLIYIDKKKPAEAKAIATTLRSVLDWDKPVKEVPLKKTVDVFKILPDPAKIEKIKALVIKHPKLLNSQANNFQSTLLISALFFADQAKRSNDPDTMKKYLDFAKFLIDHPKTDINIVDRGRNSALHQATWYGFTDLSKQLIERGATLGLRNTQGATVLQNITDTKLLTAADKKSLTDLCKSKVKAQQQLTQSHDQKAVAEPSPLKPKA